MSTITQDPPRRRPAQQAHRRGNPRHRSARQARRRHHQGDLPGLARSSGRHLPGPEAVTGGPCSRDRIFRRAGHAAAAAEVLPQGLFEPAARHHADLQHPRERRADRRAAGRRDDVPSRHDPLRRAGQGHPALLGGDTLDRRQHLVRQRLRRLRHARPGGARQARRQARDPPLQLRLGGEGRQQGHRGVRRVPASGVPHP